MENLTTYIQSPETASQKIHAIERKIAEGLRNGEWQHIGLCSGISGPLLFYHNLYKLTGEETYYDRMEQLLASIFDDYRIDPNMVSHCSGISGLSWTIGFLIRQEAIDPSVYEAIQETEQLLYLKMMETLSTGVYDFLHFGMGIFYNFLINDLVTLDKDQVIRTVADTLSRIAIQEGDGIKWCDYDMEKHVLMPDSFNFGLAHGIPAIVSLLSKAVSATQDRTLQADLIRLAEGGAAYLYAYKSSQPDTLSLYPYSVTGGKAPSYTSRLGWCYGDQSIAASMWQAFGATGNSLWKEEALAIMRHSAQRRSMQENSIADAGLCHGTAGIAHLYRRFYLHHPDPLFAETAQWWDTRTLEAACYTDGFAGYKTYYRTHGYSNVYGFLEGITGIGLSLVASLDPERCSDWDKALLFS
ncbi:MAG: lanthionine synthetase C family protein [Bacteroidetes bacterium]|nr:lanthionine synthetase C family protein [Bacteroidota bacterium]